MQVSWIDPEEVAALAESLRLPVVRKVTPPAPEPESVEPLVIEGTSESAAIPASASSTPGGDAANALNLVAFRERLQSIREKAIHAGLLTPKPAMPPIEEPPLVEASAAEDVLSPPEDSAAIPGQENAPIEQEVAVWQPSQALEAAPPPSNEFPVEEYTHAPVSDEEAPVWHVSPTVEVASSPPAASPSEDIPPVSPAHLQSSYIPIQSGASVKDRLEAFAFWSEQRWGQAELLVVDEYGDLLWGPPKKSGLVLSTMMAWNAAIRASAQAASGVIQTHQQILPMGETLTLIPCQTRLGMLQIALVKTKALQQHETRMIQEALAQVMDMAD